MPSAREIRGRLAALTVQVTRSRDAQGLRVLSESWLPYSPLIPGAQAARVDEESPGAQAARVDEVAPEPDEFPPSSPDSSSASATAVEEPTSVAPVSTSGRVMGRARVPMPSDVDNEETA